MSSFEHSLALMILLRYNNSDHPILNQINDEYPLTFIRSYHAWEGSHGEDDAILYDEEKDILIPVKFHRAKFFLFAQFLFRPLKNIQHLPPDEEKKFMEKAVQFLQSSCGVQRITQPPPFFTFQKAPQGSTTCPFGIFSIDLTQPEETILENIQSRTRRYIRQVERQGNVTLKIGPDCLADFYKLHLATMIRVKAYYEPFERMKRLVELLSPENILCMVAYQDRTPQATLLVPYTKWGAILFYGGRTDGDNAVLTNKWLHWKAIVEIKRRNVKKLILGGTRQGNIFGTKYHGIQFFKERFHPKEEKGVLWKTNLKPVYAHLFDVAIRGRNFVAGQKTPYDIIDFYHLRNKESN